MKTKELTNKKQFANQLYLVIKEMTSFYIEYGERHNSDAHKEFYYKMLQRKGIGDFEPTQFSIQECIMYWLDVDIMDIDQKPNFATLALLQLIQTSTEDKNLGMSICKVFAESFKNILIGLRNVGTEFYHNDIVAFMNIWENSIYSEMTDEQKKGTFDEMTKTTFANFWDNIERE